MKPLTCICLSTALVVAIGGAVGCNSESATRPALSSAQMANLESVTFFVDGMV